jgi:uncharacterized Fe-S cluster protein YjdI
MSKPIQRYEHDRIVVTFDPNLCTHSGNCVRGLPAVFDAKARPWVRPEAATPEEIAAQIRKCPSGALQYEMKAGG